jgi:membrane protease YdiL (CAAX protease family)
VLRRIRNIWQDTRDDLRNNGGVDVDLDARTVGVMLLACVLLTLFYYYGKTGFFRSELQQPVFELLDIGKHPWRGLAAYVYWAVTSLVLRVVIPLLVIWIVFRERARDYGYRMWERGHGWVYGGFYVLMLPILVAMSFVPSFQRKYPFYDNAGDSIGQFVIYEATYLTQFVSLEAFFRGFLVFALFKKLGYYAVPIMTIPYCMIHFGKPAAESLGAILAGLALGYLALKSKSWLPGALLHFGVGITMDALCIAQRMFNAG